MVVNRGGAFLIVVHFEELVGRFEGELGRNLCNKERDLVSWMVNQQTRKKQFSTEKQHLKRKTLLY